MSPPVALTVAGTDSGGAAGTAADLTTFAALGVHGACVITAVTAQDTTGVRAVHPVPTAMVEAQLSAVVDDLPVAAVKTGMLGSAATVRSLARRHARGAGRPQLVVDPVLVATSGSVLGDEEVRDAYVTDLLPVADVVTPNLDEARALAGAAGLDARLAPTELAVALTELCEAVVLTGGPDVAGPEPGQLPGRLPDQLPGRLPERVTDLVAVRGRTPQPITRPRVPTVNDHGTGCTFSAALASYLARGWGLSEAASAAGRFVSAQLDHGRAWTLGRGPGPVAHTIPPHAHHPHHPIEGAHP